MSTGHTLPTEALSGRELLLLLEMCLDAEERCARRQRMASESGDLEGAAAAADFGATYSELKVRLFRAMKDTGTVTADVQETLQQLRRDLAARSEADPPGLPKPPDL